MPTGDHPNLPHFNCPFSTGVNYQPVPPLTWTSPSATLVDMQNEINELRAAKEKAEAELKEIKTDLDTLFEHGSINLAKKYKRDSVKHQVFWKAYDALLSYIDTPEEKPVNQDILPQEDIDNLLNSFAAGDGTDQDEGKKYASTTNACNTRQPMAVNSGKTETE